MKQTLLVILTITGIAFGQFNQGTYSNYIFGGVAVGALLLFAWLYRKGMFPGAFSRVATNTAS